MATERIELVLVAQVRGFTKGLSDAEKAVKSLRDGSRTAARQVQTNITNLSNRVDASAKKMVRSLLSLRTAFLGVATGAVIKKTVDFAADFEKALANVDTLLVGTNARIEDYRKELLELSKVTSKDLIDLTTGLYQAISAGVPAIEGPTGALAALEQAQLAAVAGLTETKVAMDGIISVTNAYRESNVSAAAASDQLFTTVKLGRVTFDQLSNNIGKVAGTAATFGVSTEDLLGSIAAISRVIPSTEQTVTSLQNVIQSIVKPTEEAAGTFEKLGIDASAAGLANNGLVETLRQIREGVAGDNDELKKLFPNIRALRGAAVLLGSGFEDLVNFSDQLAESTGATQAAFEKIQPTFSEVAGRLKSQLIAVLTEAGTRVLPQLKVAFEDAGRFLAANVDAIAESFELFFQVLFKVGRFIVEQGPTIINFVKAFFLAFATKKVITGLIALRTALLSVSAVAGANAGANFLTGFQKAFKTLPNLLRVGIRSAGIVGLVIGIGFEIVDSIVSYFQEQTKKATEEFIAGTQRGLENLLRELTGFEQLGQAAQERVRFERGETISLAEEGQFQAGALVTPEEAVKTLGAANALVAARATSTQLAKDATREAEKQEAINTSILAKAALRRGLDATAGAAQIARLNREIEAAIVLREESEKRQDVLENASISIAARTQAAIKGEKDLAAAVTKPRKPGGSGDAQAAARDRIDANERALRAESDARAAALERDLAAVEDNAEAAFFIRQEIIDEEIAEQTRATQAVLRVRSAAAGKDAEIQLAIGRELQASLSQIESESRQRTLENFRELAEANQELADEQTKAAKEAAKEAADAEKERIDALLAAPTAAGAGARGKQEARGAAREGVEDSARVLVELGADEAATTLFGAADALSLAAGPLIGAIIKAPDILNGIAGFLTSGISDFLLSLGDALGNVFDALFTGLPAQLEMIFTELVPAFIQKFVGGIPTIIGALATTVPKLIFVLITEGIPAIIGAWINGFRDAGADIAAFFAGEIGDALIEIFERIAEPFIEVGESIAALLEAFKAVADTVSGERAASFLEEAGATIANGAEKLGSALSSLNPFHSGGMVRGGRSNPVGALALAGAGAQSFQSGGSVRSQAASVLSASFGGDDVPILAQAGEAVLSRNQGVPAVGGEAGVAALNAGIPLGGGGVSINLQPSGVPAMDALFSLMGQFIKASSGAPLGTMRQVLDSNQQGAPAFQQFVPSRSE